MFCFLWFISSASICLVVGMGGAASCQRSPRGPTGPPLPPGLFGPGWGPLKDWKKMHPKYFALIFLGHDVVGPTPTPPPRPRELKRKGLVGVLVSKKGRPRLFWKRSTARVRISFRDRLMDVVYFRNSERNSFSLRNSFTAHNSNHLFFLSASGPVPRWSSSSKERRLPPRAGSVPGRIHALQHESPCFITIPTT